MALRSSAEGWFLLRRHVSSSTWSRHFSATASVVQAESTSSIKNPTTDPEESRLFYKSITAKLRENHKRATRAIKRDGTRFPAILEGRGLIPNILIQIPKQPIYLDYKRGRYALQRKDRYKFQGPLYELSIEGGTLDEYGRELDTSFIPFDRIRVMPMNLLVHPISEQPVGMTLRYSPENEAVRVRVPINCINEGKSEGVRDGGWLNRLMWYVDIHVEPFTKAPLEAVMDVSGLKMKERRYIGDLQFENKGNGCKTILGDEVSAVMVSPI